MSGLPLESLLGFAIGVSLGLLGGGGSILTVPALVYLVGQSPQVAVTTSLAIVGGNSLLGAAFHNGQGSLNWKVAALFGGAGMLTAYASAGASDHFSAAALQEAWMAFTGDLLFVGDVGRPDLVGPDAARSLAGDLHESLFDKVLKLDDAVMIYPGHGAGSLCGRAIGSVRSTTLGFERRHNPALQVADRDEFVDYMTTNLPEQPGNHQRIKAMNRRGPAPLGGIEPKALSIHDAIHYFRQGAGLLDARPKAAYVAEHVPGSVHLEADKDISNRAGFVLPAGQSLILMLENEKAYRDVVLALARVGYDKVVGYLDGGMATWRANRLPVASGDIEDIAPVALADLLKDGAAPFLLDVREPWEYAQARVPGAVNIPLGQLGARLGELNPEQPVAVICAHGNRSQSGAALLGQKGFKKVYNVLGGTAGWQQAGLELSYNGRATGGGALNGTRVNDPAP